MKIFLLRLKPLVKFEYDEVRAAVVIAKGTQSARRMMHETHDWGWPQSAKGLWLDPLKTSCVPIGVTTRNPGIVLAEAHEG